MEWLEDNWPKSTIIFGGIAVGRMEEPLIWFFAVVAALIDLGEEIAGDALDLEGDRAAGSGSLAVRFGQKRAQQISAGIFLFFTGLIPVPFLQIGSTPSICCRCYSSVPRC